MSLLEPISPSLDSASDVKPAKSYRILTNWALSFLSWGFPLGLAFFATPILVRGLGTENYGTYALALGFLSYAFSNGIGKVVSKYIPEYRAANDPDRLSEAVSATFWTALAVGLLQALLFGAAARFLVADVLRLPTETAATVVGALYLAAVTGLIVTMSQVFQYVLQGVHRFDLYSWITSVGAVFSAGGNILLVINGYGVLPLMAWNGAVSGLTAALFYFKARPLISEWKLNFKIGREMLGSVGKYAGSILIYQTLTSALFVFERSWIVRKFGTDALAFYVIPLTLALYMHGLLASLVQVMFPVVNEMLADTRELALLYLRTTKIVLVIAAFICASYIGSGQALLGLWIGKDFAARSYALLVILSAAVAVNIISMVAWLLAEAFKAPGLNAFSSMLWAGASIPLMFVLADHWKTEGIAAARLGGVLLTIPLLFYIERRFLGHIHWQFWMGLVVRLAPAVSTVILVERYLFGQFEDSWFLLILGCIAGTAAYVVILLASGFVSRDEWKIVRAKVPWLRRQVAV